MEQDNLLKYINKLFWDICSEWRELRSAENRPVHKGMRGMRDDARQMFEDPDIMDKASENQIGRIVKACALLIKELGREPIESEVNQRVERLRREEYDYRQTKILPQLGSSNRLRSSVVLWWTVAGSPIWDPGWRQRRA